MIKNERALRHELVVEAAHRMMMAARTAPKGKGVDVIEIVLVDDSDDLEKLAAAMREKSEISGMKFLLRDADNILQDDALLLIGTRQCKQGLNCRYCGFLCDEKPEETPCAINSIDVGIAIGSACGGCRFAGGHSCHVLGRMDCHRFGLARRLFTNYSHCT